MRTSSRGRSGAGRRTPRRSQGTVLANRVRWSRESVAWATEPAPDWTPRQTAEHLEAHPHLPDGIGERFSGYGVLGLPLGTGDVLALRRFPASSLGPGYASVWHRDPTGRWTFYADVECERACQRYAAPVVAESVVTDVRILWTGPRSFTVLAADAGLEWSLTLAPTLGTTAVNAVLARLPERAWSDPRVLDLAGSLGGRLLGAGALALRGHMPSGHRFRVRPSRVWMVAESRARIAGRALGGPGRLREDVRLGDFRLPGRGVFVAGQMWFTRG